MENAEERKYFYLDGDTKKGPYTLQELKDIRIDRETKVWFFGLDNWSPASQVKELEGLFVLTPPPVPAREETRREEESPKEEYRARSTTSSGSGREMERPRTYLAESILVTLFCCLPFGIAGIVHASKVDSLYQAGSYKEAKEASQKAAQWATVGFWVGLVFGVIYVIAVVAVDI